MADVITWNAVSVPNALIGTEKEVPNDNKPSPL